MSHEIKISKQLWEEIALGMANAGEHPQSPWLQGWKIGSTFVIAKILVENPHLITPEPMKEPEVKIPRVDAGFRNDGRCLWEATSNNRWRAITGNLSILNFVAPWSDLINPVLISEGMAGK